MNTSLRLIKNANLTGTFVFPHVQIQFKTIYKTGEPGVVICDHAQRDHVTLIIMGSRGLGKLARALLGSVSKYVILHSNLPVLVLPPDHGEK